MASNDPSLPAQVPAGAAAPARAPALRFAHVGKRYRGRAVLRDVSFEVPAGSSTAVVGLNGVGKSTLLRCLLDFARPDEGRIEIRGRAHGELNARAALAWLPERFVPPAHLTGHEALRWLAGLRGDAFAQAPVESTARELGLAAGALERRVGELSKGMTQKVGLISVHLSGRPIWILDEPMSGLDPQARAEVAALLGQARARGQTLLFTSHDLRDLAPLCDQIIVLHEGQVAFAGAPAALAGAGGDLEAAFLALVAGSAPALTH